MIYALTWIPWAAAFAVLFVSPKRLHLLRALAFAGTGSCFAIVLFLLFRYDVPLGGFQFVSRISWLPALGIQYQVGVDGLNLTLCLLHALVSFAGAFMASKTPEGLKSYLFYYLILVGAIYGVFTNLDLFFLYFFYEATLIPLFPMIGVWGSRQKEYGAMKLTLFITTGALLSLFGLLLLYQWTGSFDLLELKNLVGNSPLALGRENMLAALFLFGFGVIASLWPLHSWSPIGYAAAPTSVSMLHAGVLKKMGPYLILRVAVTLLPGGVEAWARTIAVLAGIGILYAGYAAIKQSDLKFMVGFSSVSHMGYVLLGIAALDPTSFSGAVLLMFSHGVMAACSFALIGWIYEQAHVRGVHDFGGLARQIPFAATCFIMASLASLGLPGFSNFAAELLVFIGSWGRYPVIVSLAVFGIFITAMYLLRAVQSVCYGPLNPAWRGLKDASTFWERFPFALLLGALLLFGLWPQGLLRLIQPAVAAILS